jgi:hypothetical protein
MDKSAGFFYKPKLFGDLRKSISALTVYASIAQLVEQGIENPCVAGSIPARGTIPISYAKTALDK